MVAIIVAACPELTYFSHQAIMPEPPISIRQPLIMHTLIILFAGSFSLFITQKINTISPAEKKRKADNINGGKPFNPKMTAK